MLKFVQFACLAFGLSIGSVAAQAVTPSPAMLEQFKKLPRAQQEQLARQYGYSLPGSVSQSSADATVTEQDQQQLQQSAPQQAPEPAAQPAKASNEPQRFGLALFNNSNSSFAQLTNTPVPDSYKLGPADTLLLQFYGKESQDYELTINNDGSITLPDLGPLQLAGLTFDSAAKLIRQRVSAAKIGVDVAISMGKLRTINIVIAGEAKRPGIYTASALTTVTQALFLAGGVSDIGSLRNIKVNRGNSTINQFDLYQLLLNGDASNDTHLQHGDVVFVSPLSGTAEVKGEVQRPAIYELSASDTLLSLLQMAGGAKAGAYPKTAVLERFNANNLRDLKNLDLTEKSAQQLAAQNGDVLTVAATSPRIENVVTLAGPVVRPGQYAYKAGLKIADLLPSLWSGLHMVADLDYAIIVREVNNAGDIDIIQFNPGQAITQPASAANISLAARDLVIIFPHAHSSYQRDQLYQQLKQKTEVSVFGANATALQPSRFGYVTAEQEQQIEYHLNRSIAELYSNSDYLPLSVHFSRGELLKAVLDKLNQQARFNQQPKLVSVSGNVKVPGTYPLAQNASVSSLIAAAGGLAQSAFIGRAELTRASLTSDSSSVQTQHISLNLAEVFAGNNDIALQSRDNLNVFETPDWDVERSVTLSGEVRFPGTYVIQPHETLAQVLQRAGGLTEHAFLQGAVFTRETVQQREAEQQKKLIDQLRADVAGRALSAEGSPTSPADVVAVIAELEKQRPAGRLVIDLEAIIGGIAQHSIALQHGDKLMVPRQNNTIAILGEVQHASSHRFNPALSMQDYLKLAGGSRKRADEDRVYVIRADGSVLVPQLKWYAVSESRLQPGDTIIVPLDTEYKDNVTLWSQITQIFYQSAVALAALNSF